MSVRLGPAVCECGRPLIGRQLKLCTLCKNADKHRNGSRARKVPQMFVSVDGEGRADEYGIMHMVSISYGREDGTSASLSAPTGRLTGQEVVRWLIDELHPRYVNEDGDEFKQVPVAFHFMWDTSVIAKDFDTDLMLVHKSTGKESGLLCNSNHLDGDDECKKFHRFDQELCQLVITEGGEGDLLAFDAESELAVASSPKRRFYAEHRPNGDYFDGVRRLDVHDTGSAFVGGLLRVLEVWQPELTDSQSRAIEWGKVARKDGFLGGTIAQIEEYSEAECVGHARVCRLLLNAVIESAGVIMQPRDLYGSGSVAGTAFKFHGVPTREQTEFTHDLAAGIAIDDIARMTYFGGLIETPVLGQIADVVDEADLNSAYPAQAIRLPCMRTDHGHWASKRGRAVSEAPDGAVGHVLCTWVTEAVSTGPFVVRTWDGRVKQPLSAQRVWVTLPEYQAAVGQFGDAIVAHHAVWWVQECECVEPFAWIADLYAERLKIKNAMALVEVGSPEWQAMKCREEAIKLIINSCYGKMAQQRPDLGKYTNLHFASFITGATRAEVRKESWARENQGGTVVYTHTDSVLSIGGDPVDGGKVLGAWGLEKQSHGLVIVQPGLAVSLDGGKGASRGCSLAEFEKATREWVVTADLTQPPNTWPALVIQRQMMLSRRLALARNKPHLAGSFVDMPLKATFNSTKRDVINARPMPGNPNAWIIPPCPIVDDEEAASLGDLKDYQSQLTKRIKAGEFDHDE